jgi:hypothetical protein
LQDQRTEPPPGTKPEPQRHLLSHKHERDKQEVGQQQTVAHWAPLWATVMTLPASVSASIATSPGPAESASCRHENPRFGFPTLKSPTADRSSEPLVITASIEIPAGAGVLGPTSRE